MWQNPNATYNDDLDEHGYFARAAINTWKGVVYTSYFFGIGAIILIISAIFDLPSIRIFGLLFVGFSALRLFLAFWQGIFWFIPCLSG
jgi:hypothetical protein